MKWYPNLFLAITLFLTGCIGIDKEAEKAKEELLKLQAEKKSLEDAQLKASEASAQNEGATTTQPTALNSEDIKSYFFDSPHQSTLRTHFFSFVQSLTLITDKNKEMTTQSLDKEIQSLPSWTSEHTNWKTKEGNSIEGAPPENSNITIKPLGAATELRTDGKHLVHNLVVEDGCGLYVAEKTSLSAESVTLGKDSWVEMRGKAAFSELHMGDGSLLDISQGQGLTLSTVKNPEDLEEGATKEVGEAPNKKGQLTLREGHNTHIDNAYLTSQQIVHEGGNLHVSNTQIHLQDDPFGSGGTKATYEFKGGKIMPIEKKNATDPSKKYDAVALEIHDGRFESKEKAQLQIHLFNNNTIATKYKFSMTKKKRDQIENGTYKVNNNDRVKLDGDIIIVPSNGGITSTEETPIKPIKLIESNIGLGSSNRKTANKNLSSASKHFADKEHTHELSIVSYKKTETNPLEADGAIDMPEDTKDSEGNDLDDQSLYLIIASTKKPNTLFSASIVGMETFNAFANEWEKDSFPLTKNTFIFASNLQHSIKQENKTYGQKFGFQYFIDLPQQTKIGIGFAGARFNIDNPVVQYLPKELSHFFGMHQSLILTRRVNDLYFSLGTQNTSVTANAHDRIPYSLQTTMGLMLQKEYSSYVSMRQQVKLGNKTYIHTLGRNIFNGRICNRWFASYTLNDGPVSFNFDLASPHTDYYKLSLSFDMSL